MEILRQSGVLCLFLPLLRLAFMALAVNSNISLCELQEKERL